jgi:hypothetical protein
MAVGLASLMVVCDRLVNRLADSPSDDDALEELEAPGVVQATAIRKAFDVCVGRLEVVGTWNTEKGEYI